MGLLRKASPHDDLKAPPSEGRWRHLKRYGLSLVVILGIVAALYYLDEGRSASASYAAVSVAEGDGPAPRVGQLAPDFAVAGLEGETYRLSDFRGKPVWLNFWASWCPPCRAEIPEVEAVYEEKRGEGLVLLAVSIGEEASPVRNYVQAAGITFMVGLDPSTQVAGRYRINGLPTHFFIDREGVIRDMQVGGLNRATMLKRLSKIMP